MFKKRRIAAVSVINDLVTDQRVRKSCEVLHELGYEIVLIGRELPGSLPLPDWPYSAHRMRMLFRSGPLFYLFFNLRLFGKLLFMNADLLFSNDLDTLLPNYLVSRLKKTPLVYDSHELFCEVPELQSASWKKRIWQKLESWIVPKLKYCITVNESIASILSARHKVRFAVIRNIPPALANEHPPRPADLPADKKIILLQGAGINIDRGAEELVEAMRWVDNALLLIIGSGDVWPVLENKVKSPELQNKVRLIRKIPKEQLIRYTAAADIGISIDKNTNPNYYYSLPNKLFDYLHAGVPVLASRLPEIEKIILQYQTGEFIESHEPAHIATRIRELLSSPKLDEYKRNTALVRKELNWEKERQKYLRFLSELRV